MLPWFVWETIFPPPLDLTAYSDSVNYEFRDAGYVDDVARINENGGEL